MSPSKKEKENSLALAFYLYIRYLILFNKQCNRVLEVPIKKEPYWNRIPDTRFYPISCTSSSFVFSRISLLGLPQKKEAVSLK